MSSISYKLLASEANKRSANLQKSLLICSFFEKDNREDDDIVDNKIEWIQSRIERILHANKWCMARIVTDEESEDFVKLVYDPEKHKFDKHFRVVENSDFFDVQNYENLKELLNEYCVPQACELIDKDEPHMKFTVVVDDFTKKYQKICIVGSFNHLCFDATTFYSIWGMINESAEIYELDRNPVENYEENIPLETSVGPENDETRLMKYFTTVFMPALKTKSELYYNSEKQGKLDCFIKKIDQSYIDRKKEIYNDGSSFVSTNDIIHSWVREICPAASNMMIAINLRNRISGVKNHHAGNYLAHPLLFNENMKTPRSSRKWINDVLSENYTWHAPKKINVRNSQDFVGGLVSNWATCYKQLEVPGYLHKLHLPVLTQQVVIMDVFCLVFRPGNEELAMMFIHGRDEISEKLLTSSETGILSEDLIKCGKIDAIKF